LNKGISGCPFELFDRRISLAGCGTPRVSGFLPGELFFKGPGSLVWEKLCGGLPLYGVILWAL